MGKKWDYDVPSQEIWEQCLRVLKPGGHLLAFAGSRTYHRMAVRIEDAGFDIRDQIMWIYGSGFPKSHNVGKALDKNGGNNHLVYEVGEKLKEARESRGISITQADKMFCGGSTNYSWFEGRPKGIRMPNDEIFELIVNEWTELKEYQQKVKSANREVVGKYDSDMGGLGGERLGDSGGDITLPATPIAQQYEGWGTALKPAHEPIVMARKPFKGSVAENVLEYGVGGINVDGCRVGTTDNLNGGGYSKNFSGSTFQAYEAKTDFIQPEGRFPANIIFECTCDNPKVVADTFVKNVDFTNDKQSDMGWGTNKAITQPVETTQVIHTNPNCPCYILDKQSGTTKSSKRGAHNNKKTEHTNTYTPPNAMYSSNNTHGDTGGASRFFYCPKASKKDRDAGVEYVGQVVKGRDEGQDATNNPFKLRPAIGATFAGNQTTSKIGANPDKPTQPRANIHPTVKPTDLMTYLIRLVTPKGGIVLDPFMGSGSTGKAAMREEFRFVGIEREKEYMEIAEQRIDYEYKKRKFF
jgi:DNA modification methylase